MAPDEAAALSRFRAAFETRPDRLARLAPGASEETVARFRREIGVPVPDLLIEIHRWRDGTVPIDAVSLGGELCGLRWHSLERRLRGKQSWSELALEYARAPGEVPGYACRHPSWLPLMGMSEDDVAWSPVACFGGPPGQVIGFNFKGGRAWVVEHTSLLDWLSTWTELAESDLLDVDKDAGPVEALFDRKNPMRRSIEMPWPPTPDRFDAGGIS